MRRRGAAAVVALALAAVMSLALAGCEGHGIYHALATEAPRANRDLNDGLTVNSVVSAGGHYYVAAGGVWRRAHAQTNWRKVGQPPASGGAGVLGLAAAGNTLCAGTERGLFYAGAGERPSWQRAAGVASTEQAQRVFAVPGSPGGTLLLAITATELTENAHRYNVYASEDGCQTFSAVPGMEGAGQPSDALYAFDAYWLTAGAKLYRGETLDQLAEHGQQPDGGDGEYRGLFLNDAGNRLYAAGASDFVHFSEDKGATWKKGQIEPPSGVSRAVWLTRFTQIEGIILIGTRDFGFYRFEDGGSPADAVRGPRLTSQLYAAHVTGFARFGSGDDRIVFAATAGDGLSSINVADAGGRLGTWDRE